MAALGRTERAIGALIAFNAKACEEAAHPRCVCACKGALHGKKHSSSWVKAATAKLALEMLGASQEELDLGGVNTGVVVQPGAKRGAHGR